MEHDSTPAKADNQYATAHKAHYKTKDLPEAVELYRNIVATHPDTPEAKYSRSQILNIVHEVIPEQELLDAQVELVVAHFRKKG